MTVLPHLVVCSHHHPSQGDSKRVEVSSHQMQTLVSQVVQIVLRLP